MIEAQATNLEETMGELELVEEEVRKRNRELAAGREELTRKGFRLEAMKKAKDSLKEGLEGCATEYKLILEDLRAAELKEKELQRELEESRAAHAVCESEFLAANNAIEQL